MQIISSTCKGPGHQSRPYLLPDWCLNSRWRKPSQELLSVLRKRLPDRVKGWLRRLYPYCGRNYVHFMADGGLAGHLLVLPVDALFMGATPYEADVCRALETYVKPGAVCLDVGAHVGYMTLLMAKLAGPDGRVYAIEADPENVALLQENVHLNGYSERVSALHMAAVERNAGTLPFQRGQTSLRGNVSQPGAPDCQLVRAGSLDSELAGLTRLDLAKIDVEGGEVGVIRGAIGLLRRLRPVVLLEAHWGPGREAMRILQEEGYVLGDTVGRPIEAAPTDKPIHVVARPQPRDLFGLS